MAYITKLTVSEKLTDLMKILDFHQINAISPNVGWLNMKSGIRLIHNCNREPQTLEDIMYMIFLAGYNQGIFEQFENTKNGLCSAIEKMLTPSRLYSKESVTCAE